MKNIDKQIIWILQEKYNGKLTSRAKKDIERLKKGEPLDYIIGFTEFLGCKIDLSKRPLIPRAETEYWVERMIEEISSPSTRYAHSGQSRKPFSMAQGKTFNLLKVLDMFAGSGCIGISILKDVKNAKVVFIDNNKKFLEQIKVNCKLNKIKSSRYEVIQSDVFDELYPSSSQLLRTKYDFVFANPPYIAKTRRSKIQKSVLKYEPKEALFGGEDGMFYIKKFLTEAKNFLKPNSPSLPVRHSANGVRVSKIFMEFDSIQRKKIEKLLKKFNYKKFEFYKDQYGKWRWIVIS